MICQTHKHGHKDRLNGPLTDSIDQIVSWFGKMKYRKISLSPPPSLYTPSNIGPSNLSSLLNIKFIKNVTLPQVFSSFC